MTAPVESAEKFVGDFVRLLRAGIVDERDIITDLKKRDTAIRKTVFAECEKIAVQQMHVSRVRDWRRAAEYIADAIAAKAKEMT